MSEHFCICGGCNTPDEDRCRFESRLREAVDAATATGAALSDCEKECDRLREAVRRHIGVPSRCDKQELYDLLEGEKFT